MIFKKEILPLYKCSCVPSTHNTYRNSRNLRHIISPKILTFSLRIITISFLFLIDPKISTEIQEIFETYHLQTPTVATQTVLYIARLIVRPGSCHSPQWCLCSLSSSCKPPTHLLPPSHLPVPSPVLNNFNPGELNRKALIISSSLAII